MNRTHRRDWIARALAGIAAGVVCGCGGDDDLAPVQRSEAAVNADKKGQDAMRAYMESKKGKKKGAAASGGVAPRPGASNPG